jgi:hypothetical protein
MKSTLYITILFNNGASNSLKKVIIIKLIIKKGPGSCFPCIYLQLLFHILYNNWFNCLINLIFPFNYSTTQFPQKQYIVIFFKIFRNCTFFLLLWAKQLLRHHHIINFYGQYTNIDWVTVRQINRFWTIDFF